MTTKIKTAEQRAAECVEQLRQIAAKQTERRPMARGGTDELLAAGHATIEQFIKDAMGDAIVVAVESTMIATLEAMTGRKLGDVP